MDSTSGDLCYSFKLCYLVFILDGCFVAQCFVSSFGIIKGFNILEDSRSGDFVIVVYGISDPFAIQAAVEAFHVGVIPAVAFTAHATGDAQQPKRFLVALGGVLGTTVGVMKQAGVGNSFLNRMV